MTNYEAYEYCKEALRNAPKDIGTDEEMGEAVAFLNIAKDAISKMIAESPVEIRLFSDGDLIDTKHACPVCNSYLDESMYSGTAHFCLSCGQLIRGIRNDNT